MICSRTQPIKHKSVIFSKLLRRCKHIIERPCFDRSIKMLQIYFLKTVKKSIGELEVKVNREIRNYEETIR